MKKAKVLLVDDQTDVLKLALKALGTADFDARTAPDGSEAFLVAREWEPDLVVTDVNMPRMDGWALVKQLRATPKLALVPVIFLTARSGTEDHIRGFCLGADDYLDKRTGFWELPERAKRALARARDLEASVTAPAAPGGGLTGRCEVIGLASLLTVLEISQRSGILRLMRSRPFSEGLVYLVGGRVSRAQIVSGKERDREALYSMLTWSEGAFDFTPSALRVSDDVGMKVAQILVEAARRIDAVRPRA